ncbi:hypothetical protein GIB67_020472 [Kingdonia uniflora]|uniref:Uncharacterized protein n=1 Tax=Kingdonia uniflora TaxID=39325 RepID=A0A7J7LUZ7_9MAGN|nr:hypothetical protein GIB67_020472 [Kingdonia uniflora]
MKSDKQVNKQVDVENQTQEGRAKKDTSNAKNSTSQCTGLGLHKIFVALPEEKKSAFRATFFAPLLLIDPIATMSTLVVDIFDHHLGDMKFQFGETIIQMKPIHVRLILGLRVSPIAKEFLFVNPEYMANLRRRRCSSIKFVKNYTILSPSEQEEKRLGERYQIEPPAIGAPTVGASAVVAPTIGSSSSATEIRAVVVRVCSRLEEYGKMLHNHGKMLERILMSTVGDSTLPLGDTPLLGQYEFSTPEKTAKCKRDGGNEKEDGKRKKAEPRIMKGKGEWQKKAKEADMPNKKKKVEVPKKEAFTDEQFDLVPLIPLKCLISKIPKKCLANRVPRKRQQVAPGEILEVENALMVDDDVEVGREENFNAISSEYGVYPLKWKKGEEKNNDDKKDVEEKVKSEEEEMEKSKNGDEKVDDVADKEYSEQPTVVTMVVAEVARTDIVFFNEVEVVGKTYPTSADQITAVSIEEQTLEVEKIEDDASQTKESKEEEEHNKEEVFEGH